MAKYGEGRQTDLVHRVRLARPRHPHQRRQLAARRLPATQADYLARTITLVRTTYPTVTRLYWYKDRADSANPNEAQYGLIYPDGTPAPALKTSRQPWEPLRR